MGVLEQLADRAREIADETQASSKRRAPEERMRELKWKMERVEKARAAATQAARELLGRSLFPGRWDWEEDGQGWITCRATFEGRLLLRYAWHAHTNAINSWEVAPAKCPPGVDRWPVLKSPTPNKLGVALIQWGMA